MTITKRSIHLALTHKRPKIRKKNKNRFLKKFKLKINRKKFRVEGCLGLLINDEDLVFHEYEQPIDRYIRQCEKEGLI